MMDKLLHFDFKRGKKTFFLLRLNSMLINEYFALDKCIQVFDCIFGRVSITNILYLTSSSIL